MRKKKGMQLRSQLHNQLHSLATSREAMNMKSASTDSFHMRFALPIECDGCLRYLDRTFSSSSLGSTSWK